MFIDMTSSVWVSIIFATTDAGAAVDSFLRYYAAATANEQVLRLLTPLCTPSPSVSTVPMRGSRDHSGSSAELSHCVYEDIYKSAGC